MSKVILTGDRPTGRLHVGHYVGSLKRRVELRNSREHSKVFPLIKDGLHGMWSGSCQVHIVYSVSDC